MEGLDLSVIPTDLILNLLNIVILYFIVRSFVYKPVRNFMDNRTAKIKELEEDAASKVEEALKIKEQYESLIAKGEDASKEIIRKSEQKATEEALRIVAEANKKSEEILEQAKIKAESERQQSLESMKTDVASLAIDMCQKILSRDITDMDNRRIAEKFFADSKQ